MSPRCDVLVVGAGPAGSAAALTLASRGLDVLVAERARLPRDKLCGEFLSPDAVRTLEALGLGPDVEDATNGAVPIDRLRVTCGAATPLERRLERPGRGWSRRRMDSALAAAATRAGARLVEGCRVLRVERSGARSGRGDGIEAVLDAGGTRRRVAARVAIDASGRAGLRDPARLPSRRHAEHVGLERHHEPISPEATSDLGPAVELHAFPGGYCGVAPVEGGRVNACLLARSRGLRVAGSPEALLRFAASSNHHLARRLAGLRPLGARFLATSALDFSAPGPQVESACLAAGDSAGVIAPLCGDGMAIALRSAELACDAVEDVLSRGRTLERAAADHARRWHDELDQRFRLGRWIQAALLQPRLAAGAVAAGRLLPVAVDWIVQHTRDWPRATAEAGR